VKILQRRWLSTQPIESQAKVDRTQSGTATRPGASQVLYNLINLKNTKTDFFNFLSFL